MSANTKNDREILITANRVIDMYHGKKEELIPILTKLNREIGYIPKDAMELISTRMHIPLSHIYSVATFYHMLFTKKTGRHVIKFCESAPCHVVGAQAVLDVLMKELEIAPGETSNDGKWTLIMTSCLGFCGAGAVMMVDENIHENITPNQIPDILSNYE